MLNEKAKMSEWFLRNEFVDEKVCCSLWEAVRQAANILVIEISTPGSDNPASITIESAERKYTIEVHRKK